MDYAPGAPKPDFKITEGPNIGKTVDFMFTVDSPYAASGMNNNFMRTASQVTKIKMRNQISFHLQKAVVVPLDFRNLTLENQNLLMEKIINPLAPADKAKLLILR